MPRTHAQVNSHSQSPTPSAAVNMACLPALELARMAADVRRWPRPQIFDVYTVPENYAGSWPRQEDITEAAFARAGMTWEELAQDTYRLGWQHPLLLAAVRDLEVEGQAALTAEKTRHTQRFQAKRRRVLQTLREPKSCHSTLIFHIDAAGVVQKTRNSRGAAYRAAKAVAKRRAAKAAAKRQP